MPIRCRVLLFFILAIAFYLAYPYASKASYGVLDYGYPAELSSGAGNYNIYKFLIPIDPTSILYRYSALGIEYACSPGNTNYSTSTAIKICRGDISAQRASSFNNFDCIGTQVASFESQGNYVADVGRSGAGMCSYIIPFDQNYSFVAPYPYNEYNSYYILGSSTQQVSEGIQRKITTARITSDCGYYNDCWRRDPWEAKTDVSGSAANALVNWQLLYATNTIEILQPVNNGSYNQIERLVISSEDVMKSEVEKPTYNIKITNLDTNVVYNQGNYNMATSSELHYSFADNVQYLLTRVPFPYGRYKIDAVLFDFDVMFPRFIAADSNTFTYSATGTLNNFSYWGNPIGSSTADELSKQSTCENMKDDYNVIVYYICQAVTFMFVPHSVTTELVHSLIASSSPVNAVSSINTTFQNSSVASSSFVETTFDVSSGGITAHVPMLAFTESRAMFGLGLFTSMRAILLGLVSIAFVFAAWKMLMRFLNGVKK